MTPINQGRINNAVRALDEWHRQAVGPMPDRNDLIIFSAHVRAVLAADDRYLVGQTAPKADADRLRLKLAKAKVRLEELQIKVREAQAAKEAANRRERIAAQQIAEAERVKTQAKGWERSAEEYVRQANVLRQQLLDAGIEPDRRAS